MAIFFDPTGRATYGIAICARCSRKMSLEDLYSDPNSPGLMVCRDDLDELDPYRLPARQSEKINLDFVRPDEPLVFNEAPLAPGSLSILRVSAGLQLSWMASVGGATPTISYTVFRAVSFGPFVSYFTTQSLSFTDTATTLGIKYQYYVVANQLTGPSSGPSNIVDNPMVPLFIAASNISSTSMIATSTDGITWVQRTTPTVPGLIGGICFSPSLARIMAVGQNGGLSSDDAVNWVTRTMPLQQWLDVDWSPTLNLFCAVSDGATGFGAATSPDGITWTLRATPNRQWSAVRWFAKVGLFVAGAVSGGLFADTQRVMTSPDGINWTPRTTPLSGGGAVGLYRASTSPLRIVFSSRANFGQIYSDDGLTWAFNTDGLAGTAWANISYGSGLGLWTSSGGTSNMNRSPTGINPWTGGVSTKSVEGLAYSIDLNMFVGGNTSTANTQMLYSFNGINWTLASTPAGMNGNNWNSVCYALMPF